MKKFILIILVLILTTGKALAQKGLNCNPVFQGKIVPSQLMIKTEVGGGRMSTYKLDYYHSVQFQAERATAMKVAGLVFSDSIDAERAETDKDEGLLTYALIELKPYRKIHRYLCYQARPVGMAWVITIIYLEGVATLEDLRSMFDQQ